MKKVRVIYNPSSGRQLIQKRIDNICKILMDNGYIVGKFATTKKYDATEETIKTCSGDWDIIIACGGDGTVNEVATGIAKSERKIPVAILAAGTVNDFATFMKIPKTAQEFCEMIMKEDVIDVDLGRAGESYFVNVAAAGLLTNVAHQVPSELKTALGRIAYYIEGLKEMPKQMFKPLKVKIESEEYSAEDDILMFLISNSSSVGGFNLAPNAEIEDGYLDCLIIKKAEIQNLIVIFLKALKGEHVDYPGVEYFKTKNIRLTSLDENDLDIDVDGELAGKLPVEIEVIEGAFKVFKP